ncbi:MAG TPA: asparagine synthase (glutamine-hydrolyzing) [Candidatus Hydrogenedentes bacterium]|nr:asparagine synthase (glutamine-hydrolyzing) [Candidatus Hydrogenedentota bacterium]HPG65706.1 asparagine synthase (glutamine-hydrolyzing) [Candidatus Hydrogenedentota bacterium]
MCGICGLVCLHEAHDVDLQSLAAMNEAMTHRGPDEAGLWAGGSVALAMRRLSILDLEGGHQPMANEDGSVVAVFNGEIYNFRELRRELETLGHTFRCDADTEVIVHAYEAYGDAMIDRLNGMFAIAVYDTHRHRLLLARDRLGIKPLHYAVRDGTLAFASELDALLRSGLVRGAMNPAAIDAYFSYLYIPSPDTIFEDARKLRPGEKLVVENGTVSTNRYWQLPFAPDNAWTLDSAADMFSSLIEDSVRLRRMSDVPLGAFLSGGLDSSTVVALMSRQADAPVRTFTIGFDDVHANEMRFARTVALAFGTDHTEEMLRPDLTRVAADLARHFGEPFADSSALPTWLVSQIARRHVTVALSGDGGDESFAGYTWLHRTRRVAAYRRAPEPLRRLVDVTLRLAPASPAVAKLQRFSADSFLDPFDVLRRRETCFSEADRAALYGRALARRVAATAVDRFREHADASAELDIDNRMLYQDTTMYLPDDILTKVDRMSMACSLEARVPLLDHRIVEFAATVPFHLKYAGGSSKCLVRHAMRGILPEQTLAQRKHGFAIPIQKWFREELGDAFTKTVLADEALCRRFLHRETAARIFAAHRNGREDYGHHLWALMTFEHWLRYVDGVVEPYLSE